jgi:hypothetical protein
MDITIICHTSLTSPKIKVEMAPISKPKQMTRFRPSESENRPKTGAKKQVTNIIELIIIPAAETEAPEYLAYNGINI